jgi:hypothetical protein
VSATETPTRSSGGNFPCKAGELLCDSLAHPELPVIIMPDRDEKTAQQMIGSIGGATWFFIL